MAMARRPLRPFGLELRSAGREAIDEAYLLAAVRRHKLVVVRGFEAQDERCFLSMAWALAACANAADEGLLHWEHGPLMHLRVQPKAENYLFTQEAVPFHWDGAFSKEPLYLVFGCVEAPGGGAAAGGETLFCDSERLRASLSREEEAMYARVRLTYRTEKKAHYGGTVTRPMLQRHPLTGVPTLRFAEPVETRFNPVRLDIHGPCSAMSAHEKRAEDEALVESMRSRLYDPRYCYAHRWERGDIVLADNFSLLHGRRAFFGGGARHLMRAQILPPKRGDHAFSFARRAP